jgi:hypothetical protein
MATSRTRAAPPTTAAVAFRQIAQIEVEAVTPSQHGFILTGAGSDHARYRFDMYFELPLDQRTRTVLGELLSQSDLTVYRSDTPARNS